MYQLNEFLLSLGLSGREVKIYLNLLAFGSQAGSVIAKKLKLPRSSVLFCLEQMAEKGFVKKEISKGTQFFSPVAPRDLSKLIDHKKNILNAQLAKLNSLLPDFDGIVRNFTSNSRIQVYEGVEGIMKMIDLQLRDDVPIYFISAHDFVQEIRDYINEIWVKKRKQYKTKCKMLIADSPSARKYVEVNSDIYEWLAFAMPGGGNYKFELTVTFFGDEVHIISGKQTDLTGVVIHSTYLVKTMISIFELFANTNRIEVFKF